MPTTPYRTRFGGLKIRLPGRECAINGQMRATERDIIVEKMSMSIMDFIRTGNDKDGNRPTEFDVRYRVDPTFLYMDLLCVMQPPTEALVWNTSTFNIDKFRANIDEALRVALNDWASVSYDTELHASDQGITRRPVASG